MVRDLQNTERLKLLFDEYGQTMIKLIIEYAEIFKKEPDSEIPENSGAINVAKQSQRVRLFKNVEGMIKGFIQAKTPSTKN